MNTGLLKQKNRFTRAADASVTCYTSRLEYADIVLLNSRDADKQLTVCYHILGTSSSILVLVIAEEKLTTQEFPRVARLRSLSQRSGTSYFILTLDSHAPMLEDACQLRIILRSWMVPSDDRIKVMIDDVAVFASLFESIVKPMAASQ